MRKFKTDEIRQIREIACEVARNEFAKSIAIAKEVDKKPRALKKADVEEN